MKTIIQRRITAQVDDDFVVFLIGMRINKWWKVHQWLPVATAMTGMIKELYNNPEMGLISHEQWFSRTTIMVQYWKSFEHLEEYAKSSNSKHLPAWSNFNKKIKSNGDVGIWHETYLLKPGNFESVDNNMPEFGLAKAMHAVPARGHLKTAKQRIQS